ncbi:MAG: hypothetical protein QOI99_1206, partial [Actinomycetota bacterium]|nr:hypothetical protein [Actinomycetota bacterium]
HRYETALAYRDERRASTGEARGDFEALLALVVELTEDQLQVQPIHRVITGLPDDFDIVGALAPSFDVEEVFDPPELGVDGSGTLGGRLAERMAHAGALALLVGDRTWLLRPRPAEAEADGSGPGSGPDADGTSLDQPDALLLDVALVRLPDHQLDFHHSAEVVAELARAGKAQAAVLVRPVAVEQIAAAARAGHRMPPKTTFFAPKPRTGLVFRRVDD